MSSVVFSLRVPAETPFRELAGEVAGRYLEVTGGSVAAAASFATEVGRVVDAVATAGAEIDLTVSTSAIGIEVCVTSAGRTERCTVPLPARE